MPVIVKASGTNFTPAPAGAHAAVCVDVIDLGELKVEWGGQSKMQHKIKLVWQIDEDRDDGKPYQVSRRYTASLHEKSGLRKDLESWRGRPFTEAELKGFDVEKLIGIGCMLNVIHSEKGGETYANVASLMKLPKGMAAPDPRDYTRVKDRTDSVPVDHPVDVPDYPMGITDDDVPFMRLDVPCI